jgi:hypothetical protein
VAHVSVPYLLNKYHSLSQQVFMERYYAPSTLLGARDIVVNSTGVVPALVDLCGYRRDTNIYRQ